MDFFYVKPEDVTPISLVIRDEESKHLVRVLRKTIGDRIFATDGNDTMYEGVITEIGKSDTRCDIDAMHKKYHESHLDVTLAVSLLKNPARFDYLVEKATELGVRIIIPIICENTIPHHEKHNRLKKIALAAMKQCGRSWLPRIQPTQLFETLVNNSTQWTSRLIPHEKADISQSISLLMPHREEVQSILIAVGPEGGFSDEEITLAMHARFNPVSLGPRRLRTETAAVAIISQLL
jgi:16S rRNA (uracil1498-N3)-methyltransferase